MADCKRRVTYVAGFHRPVGGLAVGKTQIISNNAEIYICNGSEFVYVYDKRKQTLKAVYQFPGMVWRLELHPNNHFYALCACNGIYCVPLNQESRLIGEADSKAEVGFVPHIFPVDVSHSIIKDSDIATFILVNETIIAVAKNQHGWRVTFFKSLNEEGNQKYKRVDDLEISIVQRARTSSVDGGKDNDELLPVLCCVYPPALSTPAECTHSDERLVIEPSLFSLLFGVDATMLHTPMILCGFPDGQLCCLPLKRHNFPVLHHGSSEAEGRKSPILVLHQLEQPIIFISALRSKQDVKEKDDCPQTKEGLNCDCVVVVGYHGRIVVIKASNKLEMQVPDFRQYHLGWSPIVCGYCTGTSLYYSTSSELCVLEMICHRKSRDSEVDIRCGELPLSLSPVSLSICSILALTVSSVTSEGDAEFWAVSATGKLMICRLPRSPDKTHHTTLTSTKATQKIKELLSGIGSVSDRVTSLNNTIQQKNKALIHLNQVLNVSSVVLSGQESLGKGEPHCRQPISCSIATEWSRLLSQESLIISCVLENFSGFTLEEGWTLCIQLSAASCVLTPDSTDMAITFTFPIKKLLSGNKMEVTVPMNLGKNGQLTLPVNVHCTLFYSLTGILRSSHQPADDYSNQFLNREGICVTLNEHTIDLLHCLNLSHETVSEAVSPAYDFPADPVEIFLKSSQSLLGQTNKIIDETLPHGPDSTLERTAVGPFVASIKVSSCLLQDALKESTSGNTLGCAVLQWLLSDNTEVATIKTLKVPIVCGTAPDRSNVRLLAKQISLKDLSPEGPVGACEIHLECASLSVLCHLHHAVIHRIQNLLKQRTVHCNPLPSLRVQHLQELLSSNEVLLKRVQCLRDYLCLGTVMSSRETTEKLLQIYQELRNSNLIIL